MAFETNSLADASRLDASITNGMLTIHLFQNNFAPTKASVVGDFTEADFDGYFAINLVWFPAFVNATPAGQKNAASVTWVRAVGATSNTIYGVYVLDNLGALAGYELFGSPVPMVTPIVDVISYQLSPTEASV